MGSLCLGLAKFPGTDKEQRPYKFVIPLMDTYRHKDLYGEVAFKNYVTRLQGMMSDYRPPPEDPLRVKTKRDMRLAGD